MTTTTEGSRYRESGDRPEDRAVFYREDRARRYRAAVLEDPRAVAAFEAKAEAERS